MTVSFFYTKKYSISTTTEYAVGIDTFSGTEYSIPADITNLEVDNIKINQALYDAFATTGNPGQVLVTDSTKVYWGNVAGSGIYDEGSFVGIVTNLNFVDGTDPNNLVKAQLGIDTSFVDVYVSDRWSSVTSGIDTNIYRMSNVGIGTTNPTSNLQVVGDTLFTGITTLGLGATTSPESNSQMSFELTNDTTLTVRVRGSDGVVRTGIVTLS